LEINEGKKNFAFYLLQFTSHAHEKRKAKQQSLSCRNKAKLEKDLLASFIQLRERCYNDIDGDDDAGWPKVISANSCSPAKPTKV